MVDIQLKDGLLIWHIGIAEAIGLDRTKHFLDRYAALPLVKVGGRFKGRLDLSSDNYRGCALPLNIWFKFIAISPPPLFVVP